MEYSGVVKEMSAAEVEAYRTKEAFNRDAAFRALPVFGLGLKQALAYMSRWSDSYTRMGMVVRLRRNMGQGDWLALLGNSWTCCDNIREYGCYLRRILGTACPLLPMMTIEEQVALASLPDRITIYRGCSSEHLTGASWSLDPDVARRFPTLNRYAVSDPVLVTARVAKEDVLALPLHREEMEIVTYKARRIIVEPIPQGLAVNITCSDQEEGKCRRAHLAHLRSKSQEKRYTLVLPS